MSNTKISVACCTYNGEKYILEQLQSIANQTRLPDEVIICDDGSIDKTIPIIQEFSKTSPFPIHIFENKDTPLRTTKNFEKAINLCRGDIIVLADQDDVWMPQKIDVIENAINEGVDLVFTNASMVNEELESLGYTLFESLKISEEEKKLVREQNLLQVLLRRNVVTGATLAFKKQFTQHLTPISSAWIHDMWIGVMIACTGNTTIIDEPLIKYRQHSANQIGAKKRSIKEIFAIIRTRKLNNLAYSKLLQGYEDVLQRVKTLEPSANTTSIKSLENKIRHLHVRINLLPVRTSLLSKIKDLFNGNYHKYSKGYISFIRDICMYLQNSNHVSQK